jgi:hypothetical protein
MSAALIVVEGLARLQWAGSGAEWQLTGIWPSSGEQRLVTDHLAAGRPLLVVLDLDCPSVPVWRSELGRWLPPLGLVNLDLMHPDSTGAEDDELVDVAVPFLDWLPERLRSRGRRFSEQVRELKGGTAAGLLAPLIVEEAPDRDAQVRFVHRTGARVPTADELAQLADRLLSLPVAV